MKLQSIIILIALLGLTAVASRSYEIEHQNKTEMYNLFQQFKAEHKKFYSFREEARRFNIFLDNMQVIQDLQENDEGTAEYGINQYADMTTEEFVSTILMPSVKPTNFTASKYLGLKKVSTDAPSSFDWRDHGAVTPVKDQGSVGTCWTFSTTGNIEGQYFLAGNNLTALSEEQIVDCDGSQEPSTGHADCGVFGGWPYLAFEYVIRAGGLQSESQYPYCVGTGSCYPCPAQGYNQTLCGPPSLYCNATAYPCKQGKAPVTAVIEDWKALSTDENILKQQLFEIGPISVALDASNLQFYKKGIYAPKSCSKTDLDHAVLLVGYGTENNTDYWIVKNSWGAKWGEKGFFRIKRGTGQCGINTQPATSIISKSELTFKYMIHENYEQTY